MSRMLYGGWLLGLLLAAQSADLPAGRAFETVKVADGIYAFISPPASSGIVTGNSVLIVGDDGALVVDSGHFPSLVRRVIAEIRSLTNQPVRYLAHTHWHADHVMGDAEYQDSFPGLTILSTAFTRSKILTEPATYKKDVAEQGPGAVERMRQLLAAGKRGDGTPLSEADRRMIEAQARDYATVVSELAGARLVSPDVTFEGNLTVHLGRREVRLQFLGRGNTAGDTVVSVPDVRVVATGDLLVSPTPYGHGGYPGEWIETLRQLMAMDAAAIVPGHGPVMRDWSYAGKLIPLLESVRSQTRAAVDEGATLEETRRRVKLDRFEKEFAGDDPARARAFRAFFVEPIVERAYQEAKGSFSKEGTVRPKK